MTVRDLKDELSYYDDDQEVVFEINDDIEPHSITQDKYGFTTVNLDSKLEVFSMGDCNGDMLFVLEVKKDE